MATHDVLINDSALRSHPEGVAIALQLPWYRSLWLSAVQSVDVSVDGDRVAPERLSLELAGGRHPVAELPDRWDVLWFVGDHPLLVIEQEEASPVGASHRIELSVVLRLPYMQIAPGTPEGPGTYVPNHVTVDQELIVRDSASTGTPSDGTFSVTDRAGAEQSGPAEPAATGELPFGLGLTLYSATAELVAGQLDLDSTLQRVADLGIGPGIEIVASQTLRSYPDVTESFVERWRRSFDRYGFTATSFGANLDMGRRNDRDMTLDEEYDFTRRLFDGAHRLGFPLVRIQSAKPELLRRLLPLAEELELKMAYEIHAPHGPDSEPILRVREVYEELDSPLLGFVADFSSTMRRMAPTLLGTMGRMGLDSAALDRLQEIWATDEPIQVRQEEFLGYLRSRGIDPATLGPFARLAFNMQGHVDVEAWQEIMPQIMHVHAKFYDIDEDGQEPAIDYPRLVRIFADGGFRGWFSSEWEGHAFADLGQVDSLELVRRQHDLIRRSVHAR
ncbi:DUF6379 domain-containing protein [Nesterenkonia sp. CL21]|uniref:C-glycoside deglycosidase beta subunit domain-containing protein n=1 Tax=Nesterenkonia sp. CL21 TaxID=3064894 RepID=UPI0028789F82|nr:DUF6379 domain-containing protein [Nesterenkonia sp. CL21]MDS2173441.1 DUF6379 domain-containing protein [Nesterenkonia sp. CL21]